RLGDASLLLRMTHINFSNFIRLSRVKVID
ncbi:MAG: hypothetical protein ACI9JO_000911, partial [Psychrobacter okhotskensis]